MSENKTPHAANVGGRITEQHNISIRPSGDTGQPFHIGDLVQLISKPKHRARVLGVRPWHGSAAGWLVQIDGDSVRTVCASTLKGVSHA